MFSCVTTISSRAGRTSGVRLLHLPTYIPFQPKEESLGVKLKGYFHFYRKGVSQTFSNYFAAKRLERTNGGVYKSRADFQFVYHGKADLLKLLPFLGILLVAPEAIPFLLVFAPSVVPSTCILPAQQESRWKKIGLKRQEMALIAESFFAQPNQHPSVEDFTNPDNLVVMAKEYGEQYKDFPNDCAFVKSYFRYIGLGEFGPKFWLNRKWNNYKSYILTDDQYLSKEDLDKMCEEDLNLAAQQRAIDIRKDVKKQLNTWIDLHLNKKVPLPLLIQRQVCLNIEKEKK